MKKPICKFCGEYTECTCYWDTCAVCKNTYSNFDSENQMYEYRGFLACGKCFEELQEKVNYKREQVMEVVEGSTKSQREGEFVEAK